MLNNVGVLCQVVDGVLIQGSMNQPITGIMSQASKIKPGQCYFDVQGGEGGNKNILVALKKGATTLVISKHKKTLPFDDPRIAVIAVPRVWGAFWQCVTYHRDQMNIPIIGVTGTSGKTTTKEMIASILRRQYRRVLKTIQNCNLPSFVPSHLMMLTTKHDAAVFEIGMNQIGQIERQSRTIKPLVGIITNIGQGHVGNLGSKEQVIVEKSAIRLGIPEKGYLLINADDPNSKKVQLAGFMGKVLTYGLDNKAHFKANIIETGPQGSIFETEVYGKRVQFEISIPGRHNVYNALAAVAAASLFHVDVMAMKRGLLRFRRPKYRLEIIKGIRNSLLINDCYNANPDSVIAGLEVLKEHADNRISIAVLGNMLEQGVFSLEAHQRVGRRVQELGINRLITVGRLARQIAKGAVISGMSKDSIECFDLRFQASSYLRKNMPDGAVCLFKGSRAAYLERMVEFLREKE